MAGRNTVFHLFLVNNIFNCINVLQLGGADPEKLLAVMQAG